MGLFETARKGLAELLMPKQIQDEQKIREYFTMLTGYQPVFSSFEGGLYEMELTRACVHSFASHVSKLRPVVSGPGNTALEKKLQAKPNPIQDTSKFLYQIATLLSVYNNVLIVPLYDKTLTVITGYLPMMPQNVSIVERGDTLYVRYMLPDGRFAAIELDRCGIVTQMQLHDAFFGESNQALKSTLDLMHSQSEGIQEGIKSSATIRFMAQLAQTLKPEAIEAERKRFVETNFSNASGGVLLFDQKYSDIRQVTSQPFVVDADQQKIIQENVYTYFGTNSAILQNKFTSAEWNAYYEGKIEPFSVQLGLVMTNMTFTERERSFGNEIFLTSNRMQYLSNDEKLRTVTELFDRGFLTHNQGLEIFNLPPIEDGDKNYIRLEYASKKTVDGMPTVLPKEAEEEKTDEQPE